jgi:hypothetical protein
MAVLPQYLVCSKYNYQSSVDRIMAVEPLQQAYKKISVINSRLPNHESTTITSAEMETPLPLSL